MIRLNNVKISFPSVARRSVYKNVEGRYTTKILIDKSDVENINRVQCEIDRILREKSDGIVDANFENYKKHLTDKFIIDGATTKYDLHQNCFQFTSSNNEKPKLVDRSGKLLSDDAGMFRVGVTVNVNISIWLQNHVKSGINLRSELHALQFVAPAERVENPGIPFSNLEQPTQTTGTYVQNATQPYQNQTQPVQNATQPYQNQTQPVQNATQPYQNQTQPVQDIPF